MSEDLIRRSDVVKVIHEYWKNQLNNLPTAQSEYGEVITGDCEMLLTYNKELSTNIKAIPSADGPSGWISVNEGLPEAEYMCLVSCKTKKGVQSVNRAYYDGSYWHGSGSMSGVEAWMPLPKPWEGADDE